MVSRVTASVLSVNSLLPVCVRSTVVDVLLTCGWGREVVKGLMLATYELVTVAVVDSLGSLGEVGGRVTTLLTSVAPVSI